MIGGRPLKLFTDNSESNVIRPPPNSSLFVVGPVPTAHEEMMHQLVEKVHGNHHHHHKCKAHHFLLGPEAALLSVLIFSVLLGTSRHIPETVSMYLPSPSLGLGLVALATVAAMSYSVMTRFNEVGSSKMGAAVVGGIGVCSLIVLTGIRNVISSRMSTNSLASKYNLAAPFWRDHLIELMVGTALVGKITWYQLGGKFRGSGGPGKDVIGQLLQPIAQCKTAPNLKAATAESVQSLEKDIIYI